MKLVICNNSRLQHRVRAGLLRGRDLFDDARLQDGIDFLRLARFHEQRQALKRNDRLFRKPSHGPVETRSFIR